ncbi:uncharacterized protein METZ01_LOCUS322965, partial [marine metagenome]
SSNVSDITISYFCKIVIIKIENRFSPT